MNCPKCGKEMIVKGKDYFDRKVTDYECPDKECGKKISIFDS